MRYLIHRMKVEEFTAEHKGEKFHAIFGDPPYGLGFMGKDWDKPENVAFKPETWAGLADLLYPGGFGMVFGGSRTAWQLQWALNEAGLIIHPMIGWVYASGFPKATRISNQIDKALGADPKVVGERRFWGNGAGKGRGGQYANGYEQVPEGSEKFVPVTEPGSDEAKPWEGYRYGLQAFKPALEPIIVFQKPYEGRPVDNITATGAGAINIDGGRIGADVIKTNGRGKVVGAINIDSSRIGSMMNSYTLSDSHPNNRPEYIPNGKNNIWGKGMGGGNWNRSSGRWPANLILNHLQGCKVVGYQDDTYDINQFTDGMKPFGHGAGHEFESEEQGGRVPVYECEEGCPVVGLNNSDEGDVSRFFFNADYVLDRIESPMAYFPKAGGIERDAGLDGTGVGVWTDGRQGKADFPKQRDIKARHNYHPSVKPLSLCRYLATLLLPPDSYAPRRILVPFSGSGSEMIGCLLAGWDEIEGIEMSQEFADIADKRLEFWAGWKALGAKEPGDVLSFIQDRARSKSGSTKKKPSDGQMSLI